MATKFSAKISKNCTDFSSAQKNRGLFHTNSKIFGVGEFKYAILNFKGAKGVAMATKFRQKNSQNCTKFPA